jgi:hypothetical protein
MELQSVNPAIAGFAQLLDYLLFPDSPVWCNVVNNSEPLVSYTMIHERTKSEELENSSVRASISFPSELYRTLEDIARRKKVSLAWVVRDATEKYVAEQWPLFRGQK